MKVTGDSTRGTQATLSKRIYGIWRLMFWRCENEKCPSYKYYGGRGIWICGQWREFFRFRDWALANGYAAGLQIDRRNNDGPYAPWNCRFATRRANANNKRSNVVVRAFGDRKTLTEWTRDRRCRISPSVLRYRLRKGMNPETAMAPEYPPMHRTKTRGPIFGSREDYLNACARRRG
jgi:hypothetical protein